tara:strand:+ start:3513 stop:4097 length:585 start_codon:yes stop_codon:yes gene_type:complete
VAHLYVDYKAPIAQHAPLGHHEHIVNPKKRQETDAVNVLQRLRQMGIDAKLESIAAPRGPIDPKAHFIVDVPDEYAERAARAIESYLDDVYMFPKEFFEAFGKGITMFAKGLLGVLQRTDAGAPLAAFVRLSDELDDLPAAIGDGITGEDLDLALEIAKLTQEFVEVAEKSAKSDGEPKASSVAERIRKLQAKS